MKKGLSDRVIMMAIVMEAIRDMDDDDSWVIATASYGSKYAAPPS